MDDTFYLGKIIDGQITKEKLLYAAKNLTTHAVIVGMTGSGKTGLGIALIEEAALDGLPAIVIDPKGDLANLALTFPNLSPAEFLPWVDATEANRQNISVEAYAEKIATTWEEGLKEWGEDKTTVAKLKKAAEVTLYTPASYAGTPLSILSSLKPLLLKSFKMQIS